MPTIIPLTVQPNTQFLLTQFFICLTSEPVVGSITIPMHGCRIRLNKEAVCCLLEWLLFCRIRHCCGRIDRFASFCCSLICPILQKMKIDLPASSKRSNFRPASSILLLKILIIDPELQTTL